MIENIEKLTKGDVKKAKIKRLEMLAEALRAVIVKTPRKWVFVSFSNYGAPLPYFVTGINFHKPERGGDPYVSMRLKAVLRGKNDDESVTFHRSDLCGTVGEILQKKNVMIETEELVADHAKDVEAYRIAAPRTGEQYLATGVAQQFGESRWHSETITMDRDGKPAKIIMDDRIEFGGEKGESAGHHATSFWAKGGDEDDDETAEDYVLPVLPVVRAFDLWRHEFVLIHVANIKEYEYDSTVVTKIVLPKESTELIEALTLGTAKKFEDIVKGKAVGIIILCTGMPGTGKTLTAEVYSEVAKRPLYTVQCAQLGTDPVELEKNLAIVLERATRWRAILLIDEADVYIHERGSDVDQNAIVGVFLRLLEYYQGILFMNTNREEVIDDAIMSRAAAHLTYENPDTKDAARIWKILCHHFQVELTEKTLSEALSLWGGISGRSIRKIIRLAKMMAEYRGEKVGLEHLKFAAKYQDLKK